jgi:hypothetical protein
MKKSQETLTALVTSPSATNNSWLREAIEKLNSWDCLANRIHS